MELIAEIPVRRSAEVVFLADDALVIFQRDPREAPHTVQALRSGEAWVSAGLRKDLPLTGHFWDAAYLFADGDDHLVAVTETDLGERWINVVAIDRETLEVTGRAREPLETRFANVRDVHRHAASAELILSSHEGDIVLTSAQVWPGEPDPVIALAPRNAPRIDPWGALYFPDGEPPVAVVHAEELDAVALNGAVRAMALSGEVTWAESFTLSPLDSHDRLESPRLASIFPGATMAPRPLLRVPTPDPGGPVHVTPDGADLGEGLLWWGWSARRESDTVVLMYNLSREEQSSYRRFLSVVSGEVQAVTPMPASGALFGTSDLVATDTGALLLAETHSDRVDVFHVTLNSTPASSE